jgi:hypothetical protein
MLLGLSSVAFGQGRGSDRQRIRRGIRSGQITRDEAQVLREQQRQIRAQRRIFRSDGRLARDERREIRRDERLQDRLIRRARHNDVRRSDDYDYNGRDRNHRRGNGYYRRGAGSPTHPVFGIRSSSGRRNRY